MSQIARVRTSELVMRTTVTATVRVRIERIVAGGYGLARHEGRVLLVPMTAPGDLVEVTPPDKGPRTELVRIIEPGSDRVQPLCQHYGECGGCDLMHLSYDAQLAAKAELVTDAMRRLGGAADLPELTIVANPKPFGSRTRATWRPTDDATAGYVRRGSHEVIRIAHCPTLDPALEEKRLELRIAGSTQALTNGAGTSIATNGEPGAELEFSVAGERLRASAEVFFQASTAILDAFVGQVVEQASSGEPEFVLELYAGIGLFTVPLARRVGRIETVESGNASVALANQNVANAGLANVRIHRATVERWLAQRRVEARPEVVVVDPPRVGLGAPVVERLIAMAPTRLVYVSCDPATFARDARRFADAGYELTTWTAFDLFPQTHHVELVARFERTDH